MDKEKEKIFKKIINEEIDEKFKIFKDNFENIGKFIKESDRSNDEKILAADVIKGKVNEIIYDFWRDVINSLDFSNYDSNEKKDI